MQPDQPQQPSSNKTLWIILGVIGGVILLCGGAGCLGIYFFVSKVGKSASQTFEEVAARITADSFLLDLELDNINDAYFKTSKAFKGRQSLEQFRAFVERYPALKNNQTATVDVQTRTKGRITFKASVKGQKDTVTGTLEVIEEAGDWKVDKFTIP